MLTISRAFSVFSQAFLSNTGFAVKKLWPRVLYILILKKIDCYILVSKLIQVIVSLNVCHR